MNEKREIVAGYIWPAYYNEGDSVWDPGYAKKYPEEVENYPDDEVILEPNTKYEMVFDYPIKEKVTATFETGSKGLTRRELAWKITKGYRYIYSAPYKFGVWGHSIDDLTIHTLYVQDDVITLGVDS